MDPNANVQTPSSVPTAPVTPPPVQTSSNKFPLSPVLIVALALVLIASGMFYYNNSRTNEGSVDKSAPVEDTWVWSGTKGEIPAGFPTELLIYKDAVLASAGLSGGTVKADGEEGAVKTLFVTYSVSGAVNDVHTDYLNLIKERGYLIVRGNRDDDNTRHITFIRDNHTVQINIMDADGGGSEVEIGVTQR